MRQVDETYTVYFRFCPAAGCKAARPRKQPSSAWTAAAGYLVAGSDLFNRKVTVADAKQLCLREPRCTSFTHACRSPRCADEPPSPTTVYFKSFEAPADHIGGQGGDEVGGEWRSYYVAEDEEGACEYVEPPRTCGWRKRRGAGWTEVEGFLIQERGADLYERIATLASAKRTCAADERCTSFTTNCAAPTGRAPRRPRPGTSSCRAADRLTIYFKSYAAPADNVGKPPADGRSDWRSWLADAMVEECERTRV